MTIAEGGFSEYTYELRLRRERWGDRLRVRAEARLGLTRLLPDSLTVIML